MNNMKRMFLVVTLLIAFVGSSFAQANLNPNPNPNEDQQSQLAENLAERLHGLTEAQLKAVQSVLEDPSYYTYQEPTLTPGEEVILSGGISMPDGVYAIYVKHLNDFCVIEIEQGSIKISTPGREPLYQGWIVDKHCVGLDDGYMYLKITFLNGTYYEKLYINYLLEDTDSETGVEKIARTYNGEPIYLMD